LRGLPVYKMSGSGNDFVMVDGRYTSPTDWRPQDIRWVCARGTGIGADGLVFVGPGTAPGAVRMTYYNSDASRAAMCGNAALCSARLATVLGLVESEHLLLETDAGVYEAHAAPGVDRARLHLADVPVPAAPSVALAAREERAGFAVVGVPHLVVIVPDVASLDLDGRGRALRFDPALGAQGANVNFLSRGEGKEPRWLMRTYERGIEAETLACGTGAVAAACCVDAWGLSRFPVTLVTRSGLPLVVQARRNGIGYEGIWLEGEARMVFRGVVTT
jgi:diaminopimelate epimerase